MNIQNRIVAWANENHVWPSVTQVPNRPGTYALVRADDYEEAIAALAELTAWVNRAIVPNFNPDRKPMPINCANALEKAAKALAKVGA